MAFGIGALPLIGLAGSAISGITGFMGAQQSAEASAGAARYQAQVARNNEIIAQQNAGYAAQAGAIRAQTQDFKNRAVQGQVLAGQAASGIDVDSPTSMQVREDVHNIGRLDTETIYNNALQNVRSAQNQATSFGAQAGLDEYEAKSAERAGTTKAFSSLLGGATSFADKWMSYSNKGVAGF